MKRNPSLLLFIVTWVTIGTLMGFLCVFLLSGCKAKKDPNTYVPADCTKTCWVLADICTRAR